MHKMLSRITIDDFSPIYIGAFTFICAYFESTSSFMFALLLGFTFNVLAGLRSDSVSFRMFRLCNFSGHKFKDSLVELFLIIVTTYFMKELVSLMGEKDKSVYLVQWLVWVALYYYVRNGLRNMSYAYPGNRWFRFLYYLISFKFNDFMPDSIKQAWDKSEKEISEK